MLSNLSLYRSGLNILIVLLSLLALWGAADLSIEEWKTGTGCPKIGVIPICYIITLFILMLLWSQLTASKYKKWMFALGAGVPWAIALIASILQYKELAQCPKTASGTPMCYLSLLLFSTLWIVHFLKKRIA